MLQGLFDPSEDFGFGAMDTQLEMSPAAMAELGFTPELGMNAGWLSFIQQYRSPDNIDNDSSGLSISRETNM